MTEKELLQICLLVEDHCDARAWLGNVVTTTFPGIKLSSADSIQTAKTTIRHMCAGGVAPDLALVDLGLPDGSGIAVITTLRKQAPECLCVVASRHEDDDHLFSALRAGAQGYLLKQRPKAELVRLLQGIAKGEPPVAPPLVTRLLAAFSPELGSADTPPLTEREHEVLALLAGGYTLAKIAQALGVTRHTVAAHVKQIYAKLEISCRAEATLEAVRMGIINP